MLPGLLFLEPTMFSWQETGKEVAVAQKTGAEVVPRLDNKIKIKKK